MFEISGKFTKAKVMIDEVEEQCVAQITKMCDHPSFTNPISIMPDTHAGKGSVIGFSMSLTEKIIPNIIGVDIGCGMLAINIGKSLPFSLEEIDNKVRKSVPFGFETHNKSVLNVEREFPWKEVNALAHKFSLAFNEKFRTNIYPEFKFDYKWFELKLKQIGASPSRVLKSISTLGGG